MGKVIASFTTSLDGFIAYPDGSVGALFDWYNNGDVEVKPAGYPITFHMTQQSADYWDRMAGTEGAFIAGRRIFDFTHGWGGNPPNGVPTFVVTHRPPPESWPPRADAPFTFVDDLPTALEQAQAIAGEHVVGVAGANIAQQCINAGVLDEIRIDLAPVLIGKGVRYLDGIDREGVRLDHLETVQGDRVTHLRYQVTYT